MPDPNQPFLDSTAALDREIAEQNTIAVACPPSPDEELDQQIARTERLLARLREQRHRRQIYAGAAPVGIGLSPISPGALSLGGLRDFRPDPHVDRSTSQEDEDPERFEDPSLRH